MLARGLIQSPVLVGRDAFLTLTEDRLADAAAGAGRVLLVAGEAGIGRSRGRSLLRRPSSWTGMTAAARWPAGWVN